MRFLVVTLCLATPYCATGLIYQRELDFEFLSANPVSLVPMYFGCMYRTIFKADCCKPFHLLPTSSTVSLTQSHKVSKRASSRNRFNVRDLPDYFKIHRVF